jgi:glycosyltransferase involved in cell wall biosynthesis
LYNTNAVTVVIPTCNRKDRLLSLLGNLDRSIYPVSAVIIVDSGEDRLLPSDYSLFSHLPIQYLLSEKSVCIQRNIGIRRAETPWVFLCDDDVEVPPDYLQQLVAHATAGEGTGAVSGIFLQKEGDEWQGSYPVKSSGLLIWKFVFQLGFWGDIQCGDNIITKKIRKYYRSRGNHIARSGWPVLADFSGASFVAPVYTLGAALVRRDWLLQSPFDEVLDRYGIGDNFGVCLGFPGNGIHILNKAFVYHHKAPVNRLKRPLQYFRRALALDYFIHTIPALEHCKRSWLLWSLTGNLLGFLMAGDWMMIKPAFKSLLLIALGQNPYYSAAKKQQRTVDAAQALTP